MTDDALRYEVARAHSALLTALDHAHHIQGQLRQTGTRPPAELSELVGLITRAREVAHRIGDWAAR